MENKVLIKILFPQLDQSFDLYIPVNELVWKIKILALKSISDLCDVNLSGDNYIFINKTSGDIYKSNDIITNVHVHV